MKPSLPEPTPTTGCAGPRVELARYHVADTERILVGQRVLGIVHVIDVLSAVAVAVSWSSASCAGRPSLTRSSRTTSPKPQRLSSAAPPPRRQPRKSST